MHESKCTRHEVQFRGVPNEGLLVMDVRAVAPRAPSGGTKRKIKLREEKASGKDNMVSWSCVSFSGHEMSRGKLFGITFGAQTREFLRGRLDKRTITLEVGHAAVAAHKLNVSCT